MPPKLPCVSARQAIKAFEKAGFKVVRVAGSHHIMRREGHPNLLTVPVHGARPIATGTLRALIRGSGLTVQTFLDLL